MSSFTNSRVIAARGTRPWKRGPCPRARAGGDFGGEEADGATIQQAVLGVQRGGEQEREKIQAVQGEA